MTPPLLDPPRSSTDPTDSRDRPSSSCLLNTPRIPEHIRAREVAAPAPRRAAGWGEGDTPIRAYLILAAGAPEPRGRARAQRRFQALERVAHDLFVGLSFGAVHRGPRLLGDARAQLLELGDAQRPGPGAARRAARAAPRQRPVELDRGVGGRGPGRGPAARAASAPRTAAGCRARASISARRSSGRSAAVRRAPGGSSLAAAAAAPADAAGQLARVQPAPVGDLLALAPSGPDHERLGGGDLVDVGVGRGDAVGVQHAVEHGDGGAARRARGRGPQAMRWAWRSAETETGSTIVARAVATVAGSGWPGARAGAEPARRPPRGGAARRPGTLGAERVEHDHVLGLGVQRARAADSARRVVRAPRGTPSGRRGTAARDSARVHRILPCPARPTGDVRREQCRQEPA